MSDSNHRPKILRPEALLVLGATVLGLLLIEGVSRAWVALRWPAAKVAIFTEQSTTRGMYQYHPELSYTLTPNYDDQTPDKPVSVNSLGFRGPEIPAVKPQGRVRLATVGGSSTMGSFVGNGEEYPAVLAELMRTEGLDVDVVNAGTPAWSSMQNARNLSLRVLPLKPDLVVFYQGRNDLMPQAYDNFRPDYSHYRKAHVFNETNVLAKRLHRISHAVMLFEHHGSAVGLLWDPIAEHPLYGSLRYENHPTPEGVIENLKDHEPRTAPFRANVERMVELTRGAGAIPVLTTFAFVSEKYASSALHADPSFLPALDAQMDRNNDATRDVALRTGAVLAETAQVAYDPERFFDDCHMTPEGHRRRAEIIFEALKAAGVIDKLRKAASQPAIATRPS